MSIRYAAASLMILAATPAFADDAAPSLMPARTGPLSATSSPYFYDVPEVGKIYAGGALTGLAYAQTHHGTIDDSSSADVGNAQLFIQKPDGLVQFFAQIGEYSIPAIGTPNLRAEKMTEKTYNYFPQGYVKLAPSDKFSIMAGKLPTLFGAEYTFTFENMNIERGLLWNQENAVNRGVQANYAAGPLSFALSWNDGFYSNDYNWLDGSVGWTINDKNSLTFVAGGNLGSSSHSDFATPLAQNNSQIYNIIYTYNAAPWTITPYLQYTHTPRDISLGLADDASTYGAAVLAKYSFDDHWSLAGRTEYIKADTGTAGPNLLYGQDSSAFSFTVTPTYQYEKIFGRFDASYVKANNTDAGAAFGTDGNKNSQARLIFEVGTLF